MRIAYIDPNSYVDGPGGPRTVLFVQGCSIHCPGCQNKHLWTNYGGEEWSAWPLAHKLVATGQPVTITGGEPFDQARSLNVLLEVIKRLGNPRRHIIVYTGYTWEIIAASHRPSILQALANIDILVDGPYIADQDHDGMQWRGSANQRPIDVQATLASGRLVIEDWDTPTLIIINEGDLLGAAGLVDDITQTGTTARRCGQTVQNREEKKRPQCEKAIAEYLACLQENFIIVTDGPECLFVTPFARLDGEYIELRVFEKPSGEVVITDDCSTSDYLFLNGLTLEGNDELIKEAGYIAFRHQVDFVSSELLVTVPESQIGDGLHRLISATLAVSNLVYKGGTGLIDDIT